eukprot:TRINITY_DN8808_c0_g1_i3.p1 TRINITY_DN8808_c0_g1~~TRINITY_DN8808_c0_g1_i3.p1  ORF type:complete len:173 (-),score=24.20 TRINITY_DN8808_c0_g1_i3:166-684(-)
MNEIYFETIGRSTDAPVLISEWLASHEIMTSILLVEEPFAMVSAFFDGRVKLFDLTGKLLGIFPPSSEHDLSLWSFSVNLELATEGRPRQKKLTQLVMKEMCHTGQPDISITDAYTSPSVNIGLFTSPRGDADNREILKLWVPGEPTTRKSSSRNDLLSRHENTTNDRFEES